jgi:hypothetical protein
VGCCFVLARFFVWVSLFRAGSSDEWGQVITLRQLSEDAQKYIYSEAKDKKRETSIAWLFCSLQVSILLFFFELCLKELFED